MVRTIFLVSLSLLLLTSCAKVPEKEIVTVETLVERDIPIQPRPKGLELTAPYYYVVTEKNLEEFIKEFKLQNGSELVFYAINVRDYENMALNLADLRRYIEQQTAIIVYYEKAINGDDDDNNEDDN